MSDSGRRQVTWAHQPVAVDALALVDPQEDDLGSRFAEPLAVPGSRGSTYPIQKARN